MRKNGRAAASKTSSNLRKITLFSLSLLLLAPHSLSAGELPYGETVALTDKQVAAQLASLTPITKTVKNDPFYGGTHTYRGYSLEEAISLLFGSEFLAHDKAVLRFLCKDGYVKRVALKELPLQNAILAFEEASANEGTEWQVVMEGREPVDPSPFALVWEVTYREGSSLPWPFGIVELALEEQVAAHPSRPQNRMHLAGYHLFTQHCQACHSMNLEGGVVGPELNVPKNVTEYWTLADLRSLIENPQSYRWGSRMPGFSFLSEAELSSLLGYLGYMRGRKVCDSVATCREFESAK